MPQQWEMGQVLSNDQPLIYRQSAPHQVGAGLGLQLAGLDKPLPLLVHNLGWSSSESFLSPTKTDLLTKVSPKQGQRRWIGYGGQETWFA
jgi:hypothetical protein